MVEELANTTAPVLAAPMLGASDEDVGKLIFAAVAAVIWAVSAFVSWANKKSQETKRRAEEEMMRRATQAPPPRPTPSRPPPPMSQPSRQRIAEGIAARYPDVLLPPAPQREPPRIRQGPIPPPVPQMRPVPQQRPKRRRPQKAIPIPPPVPQMRREEELEQAQLLDDAPAPRDKRGQPTHAVLTLTPQGLRNQLVWMEILQPPLALREDRR